MARPGREPFNANPDTGRLGFRYEWEPRDERPLLYYAFPLWADETERMTYEAAVEANPREPEEGAMTYAARISAVVVGKYKKAVQEMPHRGLSRRQRDERLAALRAQLLSGEVSK